tara:strand:- start:991 stop:2097 length:1107 start_codon:yes stop_codon:yes gene_type:complete
MVRLTIDYADEYSDSILEFVSKYSDNYQLNFIKGVGEDKNIVLHPDFGIYDFEYKGIKFKFEYKNNEVPILVGPEGPTTYKQLFLFCDHHDSKEENLDEIKKLILHVCDDDKENEEESKNNIQICVCGGNHWERLNTIQKRPINSVFLKNKSKILDDIDLFLKSEKEYLDRGIKYKRNYLLYGPPGTGKTSFITSIASKYELNIYLVNLKSDMEDYQFMKLISKLPLKSLLVIEDVEGIFNEREAISKKISFTTILNTLDGFACKNRLITFITTNHKDKLDKAFVRPGRIDFSMEFSYPEKEQLNEMYKSFFSDDKFDSLYNSIERKNISSAAFYKFLFDNRHNKNILSNINDLLNLESLFNFQNLYC